MSNSRTIQAVNDEIRRVNNTPISSFGSHEEKLAKIESLKHEAELIRQNVYILDQMRRNKPLVQKQLESFYEINIGDLSVSNIFLKLIEKVSSEIDMKWDKSYSSFFVSKKYNILEVNFNHIKNMISELNLINDSDTKNVFSIVLMSVFSLFSSLHETKSYNRDDFINALEVVIGHILKLRVELMTDILLKSLDIFTPQDINFCDKIDIPSVRTPDFINYDGETLIVLETNYSSKNVKGFYSKGIQVKSSKYYEEMYYAKTRLNSKIVYCPLIFFDGMTKEMRYKYFCEKYINGELANDPILKLSKLGVFFEVLDTFTSKFSNTKESRKLLIDRMTFSLKVIELMNSEIYPFGKMMNKCFNYLNNPDNVLEMIDTEFGIKKVVEYNKRMLDRTLSQLRMFNINYLLEYLFSGRRKNVDILRLKKQAFNFAKLVKKEDLSLRLEYEPTVTTMFRDIFELIFNKIGIDSFGTNNRRERIQMFLNYESLSRNYFDLIDIHETHGYDPSSVISLDDDMDIPIFRFVSNPLPALDRVIERREQKRHVIENEINVKTLDARDVMFLQDLSSLGSKMLFSDKRKYVKIHCTDVERFFVKDMIIPSNCDIFIFGSNMESVILNIICENVTVTDEKNFFVTTEFKEIGIDNADIIWEDLNKDIFLALYDIIVKEDNVKFFSKSDMILCLSNIESNRSMMIRDTELKLKSSIAINPLLVDIQSLSKPVHKEFTFFTFDSLENNYLNEYKCPLSDKEIINKMKNLIESQELSTNRNEAIPSDWLLKNLPASTLEKSEPCFIPRFSHSLGGMKDSVIISQTEFDSNKLIKKYQSRSTVEEPIKFQGFTFYPDHVEFKKIKLSYQSDEIVKLMRGISKLSRNPVLNEDVQSVIDHCNDKRRMARETLDHHIDKIYTPDDLELDEFDDILKEAANTESDDFRLDRINRSLLSSHSNKSMVSFYDNYCDLLEKNPTICSLQRLSKIYNSITFESTKWNVKNDEVLFSDENFVNISYMILPSRKITNDITKVRYMLFCNSKNSRSDRYSYFKNKISDQNVKFTNVHEEDIEILRFRSNLFDNVFSLFFYYFRKGEMNNEELKKGFITMFNLLFTLSTSTKNIISVFKYLNIVNFSDYSNPINLFKKYFIKNKSNRVIQHLFMRKVISNYNHNLSEMVKYTTKNEELSPIRSILSLKMNIKSMWCDCSSIKDLIEYNTFYNLVEKKTTNSFHSNNDFIRTIEDNNLFLKESSNDGESILDLTQESIERSNSSLYCKESMYLGVKLIFNDILNRRYELSTDDENIIKNYPRVCKEKLLDKRFFSEVMTDRTYKRFSSTFLSSRKSMKIKRNEKNSTVKQRMIDTTLEYIDFLFDQKEHINPVEIFEKTFKEVEKGSLMNGVSMKKLTNLCALTRKEQHESDREIYILFIVTKIFTVFIQTVFYALNSMISGEMVVKPSISKLNLIKGITDSIYKLSKDDEIIFMNGDMASWSGRDVFQKFEHMVDCITSLGVVDNDVLNMTKFAFMMTRSMVIVVPEGSDKSTKNKNVEFISDPYFGKKSIQYEKSWPQGIFHNPSSFVHACEQRLKEEIFKTLFKRNTIHRYLDHSDDKNELINLKISDYETYVKYSNFVPAFFSLKSSLTKDSFSRIVSEMVGLQNIKGKLFDNPVKSIRDISNRVKSPFFIVCYKSSLSSISSFYDKSNDLLTSDFLNLYSYHKLKESFSIGDDLTNFPIDFGGLFRLTFDCYSYYGKYIDIVDKFYSMRKEGVSINKLYEKFRINFRFTRDKGMKSLGKKFKHLNSLDKLKFDIDEEKNVVVNNINRSKISERIEMFRKRDNFTDIMNLKNKNLNKLFFNLQDKLLPVNQNDYSKVVLLCQSEKDERLNEDLIISDDVISFYVLDMNRSFIPRNSYKPEDIRDINDHTLMKVSINSKFSFIDGGILDDLMNLKVEKVFKSYRNYKNKESILNELELLIDHFMIGTIEDYLKKKNLISTLLEDRLNKRLIQFKPSLPSVGVIDYYGEFTEQTEVDLQAAKDLKSRKLMKKSKEGVRECVKDLKSLVNQVILNGITITEETVREIIKKYNVSEHDLLNTTNDDYLKSLVIWCSSTSLSRFKAEKHIRKPIPPEFIKRSSNLLNYDKDINENVFTLTNSEDEISEIVIQVNNEFGFYLTVNERDKIKIIHKFFWRYKNNFNIQNFQLMNDKTGFSKLLSNEGISLIKHPHSILLSSMKNDRSLKMKDGYFIKENLRNKSYDLIKPTLFTELPSFKSSLFNKSHVITNSKGGNLSSRSEHHDFNLHTVSVYKPRIKIKKKSIFEFYKNLRKRTGKRFTSCNLLNYHSHSDDDNVICLFNKKFDFSDSGDHSIISTEDVFNSAYESDSSTNDNITMYLNSNYNLKLENFRKKGRITGGDILICTDPDDSNLFKTRYTVPEDINQLVDYLRYILLYTRKQLESNISVDQDNVKDNINLYRTLRCIIETDDRFERKLDFSRGFFDDISILGYINSLNDMDVNLKKLSMSMREGKYKLNNNSNETVCKFISQYFDFSDDKHYQSRLANISKNFIFGTKDDMNDLLKTENMKLEIERQARTKELREIENDRSKYISVNRLDEAIENERRNIDAQVKDKYLTEFMHLKSLVKAIEKKEQNALQKLNIVTKEKEEMKKEIDKLKSNNLETEMMMADTEDIVASLSEEKESLINEVHKLKKSLSDALHEINLLKNEISKKMAEKSEKKEKDTIVEKMEFTMSDSESVKGSKGFVYRSSQNKNFLRVQEERRSAIKKKIIERKERVKRARERYEKEKLRKKQKEKEDEEAIKEQEARHLEEMKSKEEEMNRERIERISMSFEEVCAPKRYKNYFATFFDPKKKVPLPHRGETNERLKLSLLKEDDLPHISNHFKNISMAFGIQFSNVYDSLLGCPSEKFKVGAIELLVLRSDNVYEHLKKNESLVHSSNDFEFVRASIGRLMNTLKSLVECRKPARVNLPLLYNFKGFEAKTNQEKINQVTKFKSEVIDALKSYYSKLSPLINELIDIYDSTEAKFVDQRIKDYQFFRSEFFSSEGNMGELENDYLLRRRKVIDSSRVFNYIRDLTQGYLGFLANIESELAEISSNI